jgi:hypothetical protein
MPREPLQPGDVKVEQQKPIDLAKAKPRDREGEVMLADPSIIDDDYAAALAFYAEEVTIRINPSTEKNAAQFVPVWVNGRPAEVKGLDGMFHVRHGGYLPVNEDLTLRRSAVEVLARAKITNIQHDADPRREDHQNNIVVPTTSMAHSFTVIRDENPRGPAWLREQIRRNF